MKVVKMYDVLKEVTIAKSKKDESIIFLDNSGRVYFVDKKKSDLYDTLDLSVDEGKNILVWVTKELDKVGFVTISIDGKLVSEHIDKVLTDGEDYVKRCKSGDLSKDEMQLFNYLYNHDFGFKGVLDSDAKYLDEVTLAINDFDNRYSDDPNVKTPIMMTIARTYIVNKYGGKYYYE